MQSGNSFERHEVNQATALSWLKDFQGSEAFSQMGAAAQCQIAFAVRAIASCFTQRWNIAAERAHPLQEMTPDDAIDILTEQIPRRFASVSPDSFVDAAVGFLAWAAKTGRIRTRAVEYACGKARHTAQEAMDNERVWSACKRIVMHAVRDGVDPGDLESMRAHAIGTGLDPVYVDEFLPPAPISLSDGSWLWFSN